MKEGKNYMNMDFFELNRTLKEINENLKRIAEALEKKGKTK